MRRAVLFDMDGVMVNSEPHWKRYWQEDVFPFVKDGNPTLEDVTGRNLHEGLSELHTKYGLPCGTDSFERKAEELGEKLYRETVTVTDGMLELFSQLRERGIEIGIVSSSPEDWISLVLERSNLDALDVVVSAEAITAPGKPNPSVYEHAMGRLDIEPSMCLVVEDSKNGVKAASRAGATVIRYDCNHEAKQIPAADHAATDIAALRSLVLSLVEAN